MKHLIIKLIVFCALSFGAGTFAPVEIASATPAQVSVGVGINVPAHAHWHHHRWHHRRHW